jgi:hypothetical protein
VLIVYAAGQATVVEHSLEINHKDEEEILLESLVGCFSRVPKDSGPCRPGCTKARPMNSRGRFNILTWGIDHHRCRLRPLDSRVIIA